MPGTIYIIVPVFNRKALTATFLRCLRRQTFRTFQTIIVDDGSTDGTGDLIAQQFPEVNLLRGDGSLWWTGATNVGIRYALQFASDQDAILVINDDVEIDPDYLEVLHKIWTTTPKALIGSLVVDIANPEMIVDGGRLMNRWTAKFKTLNVHRRHSDFPSGYSVDVALLTGWGTLIPATVFKEIGLFDDKHFQQCGDTELTVRARQAGYRLLVHYDPVIKVHTNASDGVNVCEAYSLKDLRHYFFDVKSNYRLKYRWFFAWNTATNPLAFLTYFACDLCRITAHFALRMQFR